MTLALRLLYAGRSIWAILLALLAGSLLIIAAGRDPIQAYGALFHGAFLDYWGLGDTLVKMCPLLLAGLAVILPLRAGLFNIGAEGQIYMGALLGLLSPSTLRKCQGRSTSAVYYRCRNMVERCGP